MPLEVQIAKNLPDFSLEVSFSSGDGPLGILGSSGAGKSMLLRCIAGLDRPDRGRIVLNGRALLDTEKRIQLPARERRVGMLFQHYALFPHRTLGENIAFGIGRLSPGEQARRVAGLLQRTHIAGLEHRYPREVSGGEQQRAALARALAIEPEALLLDEPLSALDTHLRSQMEAQLQETFAAYPRPALLVTHNIEEAYRLGEQLLVLSRGRVAAFGPKDELFRAPPTLEVARLTGCKNFSRVRPVSADAVEALDWNCTLRVSHAGQRPPAHAGIRAHHIEIADSSFTTGGEKENVFPCWLARSSETPFRVTLYLLLHRPAGESSGTSGEYSLQAEVSREKWLLFRDKPLPWQVWLSPDSLFLMPD
ncbi:MAG: sulfate/molybdate ABC transporter ATP-binding protein [Candidatus Acidiferrales bacterium]